MKRADAREGDEGPDEERGVVVCDGVDEVLSECRGDVGRCRRTARVREELRAACTGRREFVCSKVEREDRSSSASSEMLSIAPS